MENSEIEIKFISIYSVISREIKSIYGILYLSFPII